MIDQIPLRHGMRMKTGPESPDGTPDRRIDKFRQNTELRAHYKAWIDIFLPLIVKIQIG